MLGESSIPDLQQVSVFTQFLISKFQPMEQSHAADWLHNLHNA